MRRPGARHGGCTLMCCIAKQTKMKSALTPVLWMSVQISVGEILIILKASTSCCIYSISFERLLLLSHFQLSPSQCHVHVAISVSTDLSWSFNSWKTLTFTSLTHINMMTPRTPSICVLKFYFFAQQFKLQKF